MASSEDQFQEEVLKLFAEESLEWVGQIKTALQELETGAPPDREPKLYDTVIRSLTNLMGSAATVDLAALQKLALAMIPLLQAMHSKKYNAENYAKDAFKLFIGKDGVVHDTLKVTANALHLVSKGAKIGIRQLFAK